jgi:hypothetical protein
MLFPRMVPQQDSPKPLWIDTRELFDSRGEYRRPELVGIVGGSLHYQFVRARAAGFSEGKCPATDVQSAYSTHPPMPTSMVDLEVLAAVIVHGTIVGAATGFLRGRAVTLLEIDVIDVLKGADVIGQPPIVYLFWPKARFEFATFCYERGIGWPFPIPELGREILLTPTSAAAVETIANRVAIVALYGAEAIYEVDSGLNAPLSPTSFPEVFSGTSIRELEMVRRLRKQRRDGY